MKPGDRITVKYDSVGKLFPEHDTTGAVGRLEGIHPEYRHPYEVWLDDDSKPTFYSAHELEVTE